MRKKQKLFQRNQINIFVLNGLILKATKVRGVFDKDPEVFADALHLPEVSFDHAIEQKLRVMDATALSMCRDNNLPIVIFSLREQGNLRRVVLGEKIGSRVS